MAVVSDDHAQAHLCVENVGADGLRLFSPAEIKRNDGRDGRAFWAVVDGFVVDATAFVDSHPGGLRKLLSTDDANTGATGKAFGFSLSKGCGAASPLSGVIDRPSLGATRTSRRRASGSTTASARSSAAARTSSSSTAAGPSRSSAN